MLELMSNGKNKRISRRREMKWETPTYKDLRFGFEVTMYIYNR